MRDENSFIARITALPRKLSERGMGWAWLRTTEIVRGAARRGVHTVAQVIIWTLARIVPYVRAFAENKRVVSYDLEVYPISYDICWFLVWADLNRRDRELSALHCIFLPIEDYDRRKFPPGYDALVDRTSRAWRFQNICMAMIPLVPACTGVTVCSTRRQFNALNLLTKRSLLDGALDHNPPLSVIYRDLIARVSTTAGDWGLKAQEQGLRYVDQWIGRHARGRKLVVVTLRQYAVDIERNSRTDDWVAFLKGLDQSRYFPVIVPDTDHALEEQGGFGDIAVFNEAAWNLGLRAALYERAYVNMFVNSGPASLCILNPRTCYLLFKITVSGIHLASEETLREMGFEPNTQPPIATSRQRWIWEDDRRDVIEREFASMVEHLEITSNAAPQRAAAN